ncbi:MAG TPA: single-stranded-DNA-specific exonuclease RecJ [Desulfobacteraceae bacterium]|nr:single-stranded-DNA-specific exonuclease RecJ [Desulfobacteraceae bacterium]
MNNTWKYRPADEKQVEKIARILGCRKITATLLVNRGITTPELAYPFLLPSFEHLADPFSLKDMEKAVVRITTAVVNHEKIMIFGDFDADGISATSLLNDFLTGIDGDITWYIPHRIKEGHGLRQHHVSMAADENVDLIITVDCGSDSNDAVEAAAEEDIDVIVTDHHETAVPLPPAVAVVNPKRADCPSNLDYLAGVGVAFYLVIALRQHLRKQGFWKERKEPNLVQLCDLVALGTIADMVPLKKENRILTQAGINTMKKGERPGLKALFDVSRIDCSTMDSEDISFKIAPKINAAGRISHARTCVALLSSWEKAGAEQTADILDQLNKKRQQTEQSIIEVIEKRIFKEPTILKAPAIVLWDKKWNPGILGIAASKISKKHNRPAILLSTAGPMVTGSCRSVGKINIYKALSRCSSLLEKFGGHAMAAGLSLKEKNLEDFSKAVEQEIAASANMEDYQQEVVLDCHLELREITTELAREIDRLRPFGMGNPEPLFTSSRIKVASSCLIGARHRKMVLEQAGTTVEAMAFNIESLENLPEFFEKIAFKLKVNRFKNKNTLQMIVHAYC